MPKQIKDLCDKNNIKFTLAIYPWPTQIESEKRPSKAQVVFTEFAQSNHIHILDLFSSFFELKNSSSYFMKGDCHWNEKGHAFVAKILLEKLFHNNANK